MSASSSPSSPSSQSSASLPAGTTLGFIGSGAMATALIEGLIASHTLPASSIYSSDPDEAKLQQLTATHGTRASPSNLDLLSSCTVLVLAVKPHIVHPVLSEMGTHFTPNHLLISIAAGVTLATLQSYLPPSTPLARVTPNTPAMVRKGATAITLPPSSSPTHLSITRTIFSAVGSVVDVPEHSLNAVTGLSGSGPAYVFLFLEALSDGGVRAGLPRAVANALAAQTVLGAASMVLERVGSGTHVGELKDAVASPGGTTIAGIHALERGGFRGVVMDAVYAASQRAEEMGKLYAAAGGGGDGKGEEGGGEGKSKL